VGIFSKDNDDGWEPRASWQTQSLKDPRFNMQGGAGSVLTCWSEATKRIRAKAAELNAEPPDDDIEVSGCKS